LAVAALNEEFLGSRHRHRQRATLAERSF
jgi:hypothetical protein